MDENIIDLRHDNNNLLGKAVYSELLDDNFGILVYTDNSCLIAFGKQLSNYNLKQKEFNYLNFNKIQTNFTAHRILKSEVTSIWKTEPLNLINFTMSTPLQIDIGAKIIWKNLTG